MGVDSLVYFQLHVCEDVSRSFYRLCTGWRSLTFGAVLSADAADGEVNIIEMEVEGYKDKKNKIPIYIGKASHPYVNTLDVLIEDVEATFRLVKGSGPVYLTGTHQVERSIMGGADEEEDLEEE